MSLDHSLERTVLISARRATVFRYFTDSRRFADWWGAGSRVDPRPGGAVHIRYPNGIVASGTVVELVEWERFVFTFGYEGANAPIPPGGSRVTITLADDPRGTRVTLRHELGDPDVRDHHVQGWRYQLSIFADVVAREAHAAAAEVVDRYFAVWNEPDEARRSELLETATTEDVELRDRFSCVAGRADLAAHVGAARQHMPGLSLARGGEVRQCQGTALVDWMARGPDGSVQAQGTNVTELAPDGRIRRVTGFWAERPAT